jgi:hypothetical protein
MKSSEIYQPAQAPAGDTGSGGSGSALAEAKDSVVQTARDTAAKVKNAASDTAQRAKAEAERVVRDKKDQTARRLDSYGNAIHESAKSLERDDPNIAWFTHQAADRMHRAADYVRRQDFDGLRRDAEDIARKHPAVFFGGMFLAGLALGNVLKASSRSTTSTENWDGDESGGSESPEYDQNLERTDTSGNAAGANM